MTFRTLLRRPSAAMLPLASVLLLGACGDGDADAGDEEEGVAEADPSGDVEVDEADDAVEETDDAVDEADTSAASTRAALPPNMPAGVPIPDDHLVLPR